MSQPSLLVVDDEIGVRESIRLIFNKSLRVHEARSGEEALRKVKEETPDVILLDIMMPSRMTSGVSSFTFRSASSPERASWTRRDLLKIRRIDSLTPISSSTTKSDG